MAFNDQIKVIVPKIPLRSYPVHARRSDKCRQSFNFGVPEEDAFKLGRPSRRRAEHYGLQLCISFPEPGKNVAPNVILNDQYVDLPEQDVHAQQNRISVDITPFCNRHGYANPQKLTFEWDNNVEAVCEYTILLVKSLTPDNLIDQIRANPNTKRPLEITKTALIEQINARQTEDIEFSAKISLVDPRTQKIIKIPAKGSDCLHLRCFDLQNFLTINYKSPQATWKCPICQKTTKFDKLIIDEYFEKILQENTANTLKKVEIQHDGTWRVEKANPIGNVLNITQNLDDTEENGDLDEEESDESDNGESEGKWEQTRHSMDSILQRLTWREFPFYQQKRVLVPLMVFNSLPNMGFFACQIRMEQFEEAILQMETQMELQLRMFLLEASDEQTDLELDEFPLPSIHLGTSKVEYSARHNVWLDDDSEPLVVDLLPIFKKQSQEKQHLYLKWNGKEQAWAFSVIFVNRLDPIDLERQKCYDPLAQFTIAKTRNMICKQLSSNDADIQINTMKISLLDSLTRKRIQIPVRAPNCKHVQCFDLRSYLMMNEMRPTWTCPICNEDANFSKLRVDGYFQNVLQETGNSVEEVELLKDGTWQNSTQESGYHNNTTMAMENQDDKVDVVCLSSDDENEENEGQAGSSNTASTSVVSNPGKRAFTKNTYDHDYVSPRVKEEPTEEPSNKRATL